MRLFKTAGLSAMLVLAAGCPTDDDTEATDSDTDADTDSDTAYVGEGVAWPDKSMEEKNAFMVAVVMPTMEPKFTGHPSGRWTEFTCMTCHGENAADVNFAMPNTFPLDPNNFPAPGASPTVDFMYEDVLPTMVDLLDAEPFNPDTQTGFGCYGCHQFPG